MPTVSEVARRANTAPNTVRNYARAHPDLFSEGANRLQGNRIFTDEDVATFCSLVQLRASGLTLAEAADRLRRDDAPAIIDVAASTVQEAANAQDAPEAHEAPLAAYNDLQRQIESLRHAQQATVRRALWSHGVAFYLGMVTMGVIFLFVWWLVNG